ncbi:glycosyltransferase family 2 protein [Amantichitinum ursilacus]|uniref:Glycosyl transferase family 2 n=1 Tax=Amantichitinum ursilacus TaxID=857265 RepID=A0A0N0GLP3_9NEIS|nr:glycosyltransferase family 2 protein [Amantichitinum ursilacus]KPC50098.1 Glycosyl transferase family 2 [Amantichitinum ursilacus]
MIGAVVVTYHPDEAALSGIEKWQELFGAVAVVDNSAQCPAALQTLSNRYAHVDLIANGRNLGVAAALNQGVARLLAQGCDYLFLFDQDSEPEAAMVNGVVAQLQALDGEPVAQIGPAYFDRRLQQRAPFIQLVGGRIVRHPAQGEALIEADYLITSGTCIPSRAWQQIGPMDERLFIDFVDIEWGLRARAQGWRSYGWPAVTMQHSLGDEPVKVFGRSYPLHSPLRHYYYFRNCIALMKRAYIPREWKWIELYKLPLRFVVYAIFTRQRRRHAYMMLRGLWDGLRGKTGRAP